MSLTPRVSVVDSPRNGALIPAKNHAATGDSANMSSFTTRLERLPLIGRLFAGVVRAVWRPLFALKCSWKTYGMLRDRGRLVRESPDWARVPRVKNAGCVRGLSQIMHNGLRVRLGCYYGWGCVPFFWRTCGIHEPQEEIAFAVVLPLMPPGAVMLELGSYWAFYSMWFAQQVPGARNFLVEPDAHCMKMGRDNFSRNGFSGNFTRAFVGRAAAPGMDGVPLLAVDPFCDEQKLERVHLLHADIQGYELEMLEGAQRMLAENRVDFLFLSTHGERLHAACRAHLAAHSRLRVILDLPPAQSYSVDGLIVAVREGIAAPEIRVALRA
jgi:hypothetical protein